MNKRITVVFVIAIALISTLQVAPISSAQEQEATGDGASFFIEPPSSNVTVGETFDVSVYVDTNGHTINTVDVSLKFPTDRLQVVSPSAGKSIIGIWTTPPSFDNTKGTINFRGGIPSPGINTSRGLISTITFRVRSVGTANISFVGESKALLNDGFGTNILTDTHSSIHSLSLPLPEGPIVTSPTHPNQEDWYTSKTPVLRWNTEYGNVSGYSYTLSEKPIDQPDNISEGAEKEISYKNLPDGLHYFHIKALRNGSWGGTTHFAIKIDATPPAKFNVDILPNARTTSHFPIINFETTDNLSGISHYELRIIPLSQGVDEASQKTDEGFFIEAETRYIAELDLGDYDTVVRAYDNAGNYTESAQRIEVVVPVLNFSKQGMIILNKFVIPWWLVILLIIILIALLTYISYMAVRLHRRAHEERMQGALNDPVIRKRIEELQKKKERYKGLKEKMAVVALISSLSMMFLPGTLKTNAQETSPLPPPIITTIPLDISNDQLFYVGGQTDVADSDVIIFLQNVQDGQVRSQTVSADGEGDWFYAYREPLISGSYLVWVQGGVGSELSPPSPQKEISVSKTAFQLGASRLSYETLYLFITIILFGAVVALGSYTTYHFFHGRRKRRELMREIAEADEVIKDGFETLRKDLNAELEVIHKAKLSKALSAQEEERERHLLEDLAEIEEFIKKEFKDVKLSGRKI